MELIMAGDPLIHDVWIRDVQCRAVDLRIPEHAYGKRVILAVANAEVQVWLVETPLHCHVVEATEQSLVR